MSFSSSAPKAGGRARLAGQPLRPETALHCWCMAWGHHSSAAAGSGTSSTQQRASKADIHCPVCCYSKLHVLVELCDLDTSCCPLHACESAEYCDGDGGCAKTDSRSVEFTRLWVTWYYPAVNIYNPHPVLHTYHYCSYSSASPSTSPGGH